MQLIRKYALPLTLCGVLAAAFAAPYMIPENPDSMVFRSGVLGLLLLCAAGYPLYTALRRADRRTLCAGVVWGFLFALAMRGCFAVPRQCSAAPPCACSPRRFFAALPLS